MSKDLQIIEELRSRFKTGHIFCGTDSTEEKILKLHLFFMSDKSIETKDFKLIEELANLENLEISHSKITEIQDLNKLTSLKTLILWNNQITKIEGLDKLTNLQSLRLGSNPITKIEGLDNLTNLEYLELDRNEITAIQLELCLP